MPVSFFVDPADRRRQGRRAASTHITLSYTFYPGRRRRSRGWPRRRQRTRACGTGTVHASGDRGWIGSIERRGRAGRQGDREQDMADAHAKHHDYHLVEPEPVAGRRLGRRLRHGDRRRSSGCARWAAAPACSASRGPTLFVVGVAGVLLHHVHVVARRHQGGARGRPHAGRAAAPALRHDPVHRLGGDVLRRLVLGLLRRGAVPRRACEPLGNSNRADRHGRAQRAHRRASGRRSRRRISRRPSIRGACRSSTR